MTMRFFISFFFCLLFNFSTCFSTTNENIMISDCTKYKYELAALASNVTLCFIQFSQPLRMCEYCKDSLNSFEVKYRELENRTDKINSYCGSQLLYSDIVSIITDMRDKFTDQWTEVNCDECYRHKDTFQKFLSHQDNIMTCLSNYTNANLDYRSPTFEADWKGKTFNNTACGLCKATYVTVNKFYNGLESGMDKENAAKLWRGLCGDMGEMMNMTRLLWSQKFQCDQSSLEWYYAIGPILTISAISLIFYCMVSTYFHNRINMILYKQRRLKPIVEESG